MDVGCAAGRVPFESVRCGSNPAGRKFIFVELFIMGFRFDAISFVCVTLVVFNVKLFTFSFYTQFLWIQRNIRLIIVFECLI